MNAELIRYTQSCTLFPYTTLFRSHVLQPVGDPDGAVQRGARTPPRRLVRHPPDRTRADPLGQVFTGEALGPVHEVGGGQLRSEERRVGKVWRSRVRTRLEEIKEERRGVKQSIPDDVRQT